MVVWNAYPKWASGLCRWFADEAVKRAGAIFCGERLVERVQ